MFIHMNIFAYVIPQNRPFLFVQTFKFCLANILEIELRTSIRHATIKLFVFLPLKNPQIFPSIVIFTIPVTFRHELRMLSRNRDVSFGVYIVSLQQLALRKRTHCGKWQRYRLRNLERFYLENEDLLEILLLDVCCW